MSKISMFDPSIKFRMASRSSRPGGNVNIDVDAIGRAALNTSAITKTLGKITLPAQVQRTYDKLRGAVRPFPVMWEYGGKISETISRCIVLASPEFGMIGPFQITKIKLLQAPSSWQASTEVFAGMHIVVGYINRGDVKVLVYKIVETLAVSEIRSGEGPDATITYEKADVETQNDIAALNCTLVGFYSRDWRGEEYKFPAAVRKEVQPLLDRTLAKLHTADNLPVNFEPFNLVGKNHPDRNKHFILDENIPVVVKEVPAGQFADEIIRVSTDYREDQKTADDLYNEGKARADQKFEYSKATNWHLVYHLLEDGRIQVTAIHTRPIEVFGNPLSGDDGAAAQQNYVAVQAVFKDIAEATKRGDALAIRKASHAELTEYLADAKDDVVVYMRSSF